MNQNVSKLNSRGAISMSVCGAVMSAGYTLAADAKALYYMLGLSGRVREQVQRHHSLQLFLFHPVLYSYFVLFILLHHIQTKKML
jgi:hypothetical protein